MEALTTVAVKQVLEPMCRATEQLLAPPRLRSTDHLFIWMDPGGKWFIADVRSLKRLGGEEDARPWFKFGEVEVGRVVQRRTWQDRGTASFHATQFFQRIPERRPLTDGTYERRFRWKLAATDVTALVVHHCWPEDQVHFRAPGLDDEGQFKWEEDEEARLTFRFLVTRFLAQTERASIVAAFKQRGEVPEIPSGWVEREDRPLADYQRICAQLAQGHDGLAIFADRGVGKTPTAVQIVCDEARRSRANGRGMIRALVVVPGQVRLNWQVEFERFATVSGKVTIIKGSLVERIKRMRRALVSEDDCAFSAAIIGIDSVANTVEYLEKVPWDVLIADESHKFKSRKTQRWKAMERLRDVSKIRIPMTGTPIGNTPFDLWTQLEFLGSGMSGFVNFEEFRKFYGKWRQAGGHGVEKLVGLKNMPLIQERLARASFQITKEEAGLKLPDKVFDMYEVEMTKEQAEVYDKVATQLRVEIENKMTQSKDTLTIENILTMLLRLAQVTSGHITWDAVVDEHTGETLREKRVEQISLPNAKVEAVVEMLEDEERDPLGKTIVWCHFVQDIHAICSRLRERGIKYAQYYGSVKMDQRDNQVKLFNEDPECRVMVCNPQCAGEGLNLVGYDWDKNEPELDTYTDHEIFFSCSWSALDRGQAEDRAHRRGTRMPVRITDLVVPGTIDEEIRNRVKNKQETAKLVLDISDILKAVLYSEES